MKIKKWKWRILFIKELSMISARRLLFVQYKRILLMLCTIAIICTGCASTTSASIPHDTTKATARNTNGRPERVNSKGQMEGESAQLQKAKQMIAQMSLDQKLGQLIIVEYLGQSYQDSGLQSMITQQFVGGYMYQESNHNFDPPYNTIDHVKALTQQISSDARIPLLIATDQEGGLVNRLYRFHGALPSAQQMATSGSADYIQRLGEQAARWLGEMGINSDLAPVVDVHTVDPPVLESRMFGSDPQTVAVDAGAYLDGLQSNGIAGCLKHFPGLGAITSDPHAGLPIVTRSKADLERIDLAPYKLMLQRNHPAMIMSTDVLVPAIDATLPAELSPLAINGVLRKELGYNGVVITDGLYMGGISARWTLSQAAVLAIQAGNDLIEGPFTPVQVASVIAALKQSIQEGQLTTRRIDQSVQRILLMKMQYGIIEPTNP
jgi:beta-N-acetylhexosaminidase